MARKRKTTEQKNNKHNPQTNSSKRDVELEQWLEEISKKYDGVLRRLADDDSPSEMLNRVRKNTRRY
ncbi:MAG: hypothetical protein HZB51_31260 [Chloroflexi bacterium]|nr:hypothetical protein [Chloroflexota bacterium]